MKINLTNPTTKQIKQAKIGFSWTTFFFGMFVPLVRGDWKWFFILLVITLILGVPTLGFGSALVGLIFSFIYNRLYINDLLGHGYVPADDYSEKALQSKNFISQA